MGWGGGWGNHVPEIAKVVGQAFYEGKSRKRGDACTDGKFYHLCGNTIARRLTPDEVAERMAMVIDGVKVNHKPLEFSFAGWPTKMTARHLSALGVDAECYGIKNPQCYLNEKLVDPHEWYSLDQLATMVNPPPKPKSRLVAKEPVFINMTPALFPELCVA